MLCKNSTGPGGNPIKKFDMSLWWLALVDLFRNYSVEWDFNLSQLKSLVKVPEFAERLVTS